MIELEQLLAQSRSRRAPRTELMNAISNATSVMTSAKVSPSDFFMAASDGAEDEGMKLLCKTLSVMVKYMSTWGVLTVLVLGVYQLGQTATASGSWIWAQIKKVTSIGSSMSPIMGLTSGLKNFFHLDEAAQNPSAGMAIIQAALVSNAPIIGGMFASLSQSGIGSVSPKSSRTTPEPEDQPSSAAAKTASIAESLSSIIGAVESAFDARDEEEEVFDARTELDMGTRIIGPLGGEVYDARDER